MSDNSKDKKSDGPEPLPLERKKVPNPYGQHGKKRKLQQALKMYNEDYKTKAIAEACDVHPATVRRWLKDAGFPAKKSRYAKNPKPRGGANTPANIFDGNEDKKNFQAVAEAAEQASLDETTRLTEIAAAQANPADQYQSYMAANAVRLMRDGLKSMRPPSNVREMEVLDKIARRHFGLDEKHGGGANSLSIDINILNDAAAAARKAQKKKSIDVEVKQDD